MRLPTQLGPFECVRELGSGGMGRVYEVRTPGDPRPLALKLLQSATSAASRERFRREGQLVARLKHSGIVGVYGAGELDDGTPYLVFEFAAGTSLRELLRHGPLPERRALAIGTQIARALGHAHTHGIVHRDVKPDNIIVNDDVALLADFGVALAADLERLTATGRVAGTPAYMAPEQLESRESIAPATDVHALGAVLYELLTGQPPFAPGPSLLPQILRLEPPRVDAVRPGISPAVADVVARCLEKRPADRFAHGDALADALQAAERGEAPPANPKDPTRWLVGGAVGAALLALSVTAVASLRAPDPAPAETPAPAATLAAANPSPAQPAAPSLGFEPGEPFTAVFELHALNALLVSYTLHCEATLEKPRELELKCTITDYAGASAALVTEPLRGAVLTWTLDPRTGRVLALDGMQKVKSIRREHTQLDPSDLVGQRTFDLITDRRTMLDAGNSLFHVLPPSDSADTARYLLKLDLQQPAYGEASVVRELTRTGSFAGDAEVRCTGDSTGVATWRDGRLVESRFTNKARVIGQVMQVWRREP